MFSLSGHSPSAPAPFDNDTMTRNVGAVTTTAAALSPHSPILAQVSSTSHVLDTIAERNSTTESSEASHHHLSGTGCGGGKYGVAAEDEPVNANVSGTSSSCSVPDYLIDKFPSTATTAFTNNTGSEDLNVGGEIADNSHHTLKLTKNIIVATVAHETTTVNIAPAAVSAGPSPLPRKLEIIKETCDSSAASTVTTTSESYKVDDLPPLPAKLATLNKPSSQAILASQLRSRKARHSIDVRALPSYLARKRQSSFGQFLSG